jgi:hypothetical protein
LSDSERGRAFVDLLKEAWPTMLPRQGRPDESGLVVADFEAVMRHLEPAWHRGEAARFIRWMICWRLSGAADQVRAGDQSQNRQGPRPDDPAVAPAAGGSGDRMMELEDKQ